MMRAILLSVFIMTSMAFAQTTQQADADKSPEVVTRVYDLRDLMMNVGDYPFDGKIGVPEAKPPVVYVQNSNNPEPQQQNKPTTTSVRTRQQRVDDLIRLITDTVAQDTWRDNGGALGSIREISGLLVVTQTAQSHKDIETLLGQLREDHLRTVRVQADWLILTPDQARKLLPADQKAEGKVSARAIDPKALAELPADAGKFHAELSCFSGQTVSIASGRAHSAVTDQEPVVAQQAVAYNPEIAQVRAGAMLEITPTLESTLDTAVVDVRSQVADWAEPTQVQHSPRQGQAEAKVVGGDVAAIIDRLNLLTQEFRTTARLPVGRPILIGGMTSEPSQAGPASSQLYLVLQLTAGK
jgi:hypothetical protein